MRNYPVVTKSDDKPQADKFRDLARELECDEDEARFEEAVKKVAKSEHTPEPEGNK